MTCSWSFFYLYRQKGVHKNDGNVGYFQFQVVVISRVKSRDLFTVTMQPPL